MTQEIVLKLLKEMKAIEVQVEAIKRWFKRRECVSWEYQGKLERLYSRYVSLGGSVENFVQEDVRYNSLIIDGAMHRLGIQGWNEVLGDW